MFLTQDFCVTQSQTRFCHQYSITIMLYPLHEHSKCIPENQLQSLLIKLLPSSWVYFYVSRGSRRLERTRPFSLSPTTFLSACYAGYFYGNLNPNWNCIESVSFSRVMRAVERETLSENSEIQKRSIIMWAYSNYKIVKSLENYESSLKVRNL